MKLYEKWHIFGSRAKRRRLSDNTKDKGRRNHETRSYASLHAYVVVITKLDRERLSKSKRLVFQKRPGGWRRGRRRGKTGGPEIGVPAIKVSKFGSNWQPLKRFRGRAGVEALPAS